MSPVLRPDGNGVAKRQHAGLNFGGPAHRRRTNCDGAILMQSVRLTVKECHVNVGSLLRSSYLLYFSQPATDRVLLKAVKGRPVRSIVELGIGPAGRTERILEVAAWRAECLPLRYTAVDLFESRPVGQPKLSLKQAFGDLRKSGAKVQLVPGDPLSALLRRRQLVSRDRFVAGQCRPRPRFAAAGLEVRAADDPPAVARVPAGTGGGQGSLAATGLERHRTPRQRCRPVAPPGRINTGRS